MPRRRIVIGQKVKPEKREAAKRLRQQMTPAEKVLWQKLRANRFRGHHFRRQQIICGYIVDFYSYASNLVIEVDGPIHQLQQEADHKREKVLTDLGLTVIRFSNRQVMNNIGSVLREISRYLAE